MLWFYHGDEALRSESASIATRSGTSISSKTQPSSLPSPKPAPKPDPLPDILPEGGIPCPWKIYPETDQPELAVQESLRAVLKYVLGLELPASVRKFGADRGFQMDLGDTVELIEKLKKLEERPGNRSGTFTGFLMNISSTTGGKPLLWSGSRQKSFEPGYVDFTMFLNQGTILFKGWRKPFQSGDRYRLCLDPKTGWGTFHFEPGVEPD